MSSREPQPFCRQPQRLRANRDFQAIYHKGRYFASPSLVLYCMPQGSASCSRVGYSVARKGGTIVARNRVRRRLREIVRLAQPLPLTGYDFVLLARQSATAASYAELSTAYNLLQQRLWRWLQEGSTRRHTVP